MQSHNVYAGRAICWILPRFPVVVVAMEYISNRQTMSDMLAERNRSSFKSSVTYIIQIHMLHKSPISLLGDPEMQRNVKWFRKTKQVKQKPKLTEVCYIN